MAHQNELLLQALDRAVLAGLLVPRAVKILHDAYADKCEVSPEENAVFLNGESLDKAIEKLIKTEYEFMKPPPQTDTAADKVEALKAEALSGNVTAHGQLVRAVGEATYNAWRSANKIEPGGKGAEPPDELAAIQKRLDALKSGRKPNSQFAPNDQTKDNPWTAEHWNITAQGRYVREHGEAKAAEAAAAAGSRLGATKAA